MQDNSENMLFERITASGVRKNYEQLCNFDAEFASCSLYDDNNCQFTGQVGLTIGSIGSSVVNNITFRWLSYSSFFRCGSISSTYQCAMHIRGSPHIMSAAGVVEIDER